MNPIQKILVPVDFSPPSNEAFRVAYGLAKAVGGRIVAFHVISPPAVVVQAGPLLVDVAAGNGKDLWDGLDKLPTGDPQVPIQREVIVAAKPGPGHILDLVEQLGCDLIVMGTHGRSWLGSRLFGSITEEVIRKARCPVMVVKAAMPEETPTSVEAPDGSGVAIGMEGSKEDA